jgi:hypothetical protein
VRKSYFLEAIVEMREATDGTDRDAALERLEGTREAYFEEFTSGSD